MNEEEIKQNLCDHDPRNPSHLKESEQEKEYWSKRKETHGCSCDNCSYGRTELAEEILRLLPLIK